MSKNGRKLINIFTAAVLIPLAVLAYAAQPAAAMPSEAYPAYGSLTCFEAPDLGASGKEIKAEKIAIEKYRDVGPVRWYLGNVNGRKLWMPESELSYAAPEAEKAAGTDRHLAKALETFLKNAKSDGAWMRCPDVKMPGKDAISTWANKDAVVQPGWYCAFRTNKMCADFLDIEPIGLSRGKLEKLLGASGGWTAPDLAVFDVPDSGGSSVFFRFNDGRVTEAGWMRAAPSDAGADWHGWRLWELRAYRGDIPDRWPRRAECTGSDVNIRKGPGTLFPVLGKIKYKNSPLRVFNSVKRGGQTWALVDGGIGLRGWMSGKYVKEQPSDRKSRFDNAFNEVFLLHKVYLANVLGENKPLSVKTGEKDAAGYQTEKTTWKKSSETVKLGKMDALIVRVAVNAPGISVCGLQAGDRILDGAGKMEPYFEQFVRDLESCGWKRDGNRELTWIRNGHYFTVNTKDGGESIASMSWGEK